MDLIPKGKATKAKINTWDDIKLKSLCTAKDTTDKAKKQPMEWEIIVANHMSNKGLIAKKYKKLISLNSKKVITIARFLNGQRTYIDIFPKKTYKWPTGTRTGAQHYHIREMQIINHDEISPHTCQDVYSQKD